MLRILASVFFLVACSGTPEESYYRGYILPVKSDKTASSKEIVALKLSKPSPLRPGDTFVFNNPAEIWSVSAVKENAVMWESPSGTFMRTSALTFLPPLEWGGKLDVTDSGRRELVDLKVGNGVADLESGATYSFTEIRHNSRPPSSNTSTWRCKIGDREEIVVAAGKTLAVPILCSQNGIQRLLLNYSPTLGYMVRHVLSTSSGPVVRELTAYQRLVAADDG